MTEKLTRLNLQLSRVRSLYDCLKGVAECLRSAGKPADGFFGEQKQFWLNALSNIANDA